MPEMDLAREVAGTVVAVQANFYRVRLHDSDMPQPELLCTRRSRLKKIGQRVMVGDRVRVEDPDWAGGGGAIAEVYARRTELSRPPVANADRILLVFSADQPSLDPHQLSRFLVKAESTELSLLLCLSKCDLVSTQWQEQWEQRLEEWGYSPLWISTVSEVGIDALKQELAEGVTIVAGPSGVGKSSLINQLIPQLRLRVANVSGKLQRGRHTTRHVELFQLPTGGLLADTPGFNQPDLDTTPEELARYFPEARQRMESESCQFKDCLHTDEPHCSVRGEWERYEHYLVFLQEAIAQQEQRDRTRDPESVVKRKTKGRGDRYCEPKLDMKKYRRLSRRKQHQLLEEQELDELYDDAEF